MRGTFFRIGRAASVAPGGGGDRSGSAMVVSVVRRFCSSLGNGSPYRARFAREAASRLVGPMRMSAIRSRPPSASSRNTPVGSLRASDSALVRAIGIDSLTHERREHPKRGVRSREANRRILAEFLEARDVATIRPRLRLDLKNCRLFDELAEWKMLGSPCKHIEFSFFHVVRPRFRLRHRVFARGPHHPRRGPLHTAFRAAPPGRDERRPPRLRAVVRGRSGWNA
jgi:hypothetical protein